MIRRASSPVREASLQALILLLLLTAAFPGLFFQGRVLSPADILFINPPWAPYAPPGWERPQNPLMSDIVSAFVPYSIATRAAWAEGAWPLWNPYILAGVPLMANCQSAVFYPPRLLHAVLDVHWAASILVVLKLWLCGMTAYACGRVFGLSIAASRFLSVAWMFAGYNLVWCYWPLPDVSAWLPLVLLGAERTLQGSYRQGFAAVALGGTLSLLAGHPESAFTMNLGVGAYFLLRLLLEARRGRRLRMPLLIAAGAWVPALLLCAAQLLPFIEYLRHSATFYDRAEGDNAIALPPSALVALWVPRFFGTDAEGTYWGADRANTNAYMMMYSGMAVWLMAAFLMVRGSVRGENRARLIALAIPAGLFGLLAFNEPTLSPINGLPPFNAMVLYYHAVFGFFALPLAAAIGLDHWLSRPRRLRDLWPAAVPASIAATVIGGTILLTWDYAGVVQVREYVVGQIGRAALMLALAVACAGAYAAGASRRLAATLVTLALASDLLLATWGMNPSMDRRYVYPETELTRYLKGLGHPSRVGTAEANLPAGVAAGYGIEEMYGYDGLYPHRIMYWHRALKFDLWKTMEPTRALAHYLHRPVYEHMFSMKMHPGRYEKVAEVDGVEVYRNHAAFDRAYLVPQARVVSDRDALFDIMASEDFDPAQVALIEEPLPRPLPESGAVSAGEARIRRYATTRVTVDVDARQDAVLVLADAYYPGWTATVDGRPAQVFPVDYVWRGLTVPQGRHVVEFRYFPTSLRIGLWISVITGLAAIALCLLHLVGPTGGIPPARPLSSGPRNASV